MDKINIQISNFRCIKEASIDIDGITVLTGLNATGKSTISRLTYYIGYYTNNYDEIINPKLSNSLIRTKEFLLLSSLSDKTSDTVFPLFSMDESEIISAIDEIINNYEEKKKQVAKIDRERLAQLRGKKINDRYVFINELKRIKEDIANTFERHRFVRKNRPAQYLSDKLNELFKTKEDSVINRISIQEGGNVILNESRKSLGLFSSLRNVFYIDTPMIMNLENDNLPNPNELLHWRQLIKLFNESDSYQSESGLSSISNDIQEITGGAIYLHETDVQRHHQLLFKDNNNNEYPLMEIASGIKSFAVLQRLLQKGLLNENTLMIIDEPEAHLHPQWIVEYARIIHELHRVCGVRFLIASHSPLMVEALHNLASNEELSSGKLCYYMAEKADDNTDRFLHKNIGVNIDQIFTLFNHSYAMMDHYEG